MMCKVLLLLCAALLLDVGLGARIPEGKQLKDKTIAKYGKQDEERYASADTLFHGTVGRTRAKHSTAIQRGNRTSLMGGPLMVCAVICGPFGCTIYHCPGGVCCTPGSPDSVCCPLTHPECMPGNLCCPAGLTQICGIYCCEPSAKCCSGRSGNYCCDSGATCCTFPDGGNACCYGDKAKRRLGYSP